MPWKEHTSMTLRTEFIALARNEDVNLSELARRFGISRKTAYKWLARAKAGQPLSDRSRRPRASPTRTDASLEQAVIALRRSYPSWGGRKLRQVLLDRGHTDVPAPSTITHILRRHGLMPERDAARSQPWQRFEHDAPNDLWQMDFKGTIALGRGRCDPLTVLDDHSRYNLALSAIPDMRSATVQKVLTDTFRRYGLPVRMNMDNGSPWGSPRGHSRGLTVLSIWLVRLGIRVSFSRPAHPQTNGKDERFHRTLAGEVLNGRAFTDRTQLQRAFDHWREIYNTVRPHDSLGLATPSTRYRTSGRAFPSTLAPITYAPDDMVVAVRANGVVPFKGRIVKVSCALRGLPVAFRPDAYNDGCYSLYFAHHHLTRIDLRNAR